MDLTTPGIGLIFWTSIIFFILLILLRKFAWKPILAAVKNRENSIEDALKSAEKAKEEMAQLKADNEVILNEARMEKDKLLKEAREMKDKIINEAREKAIAEQNKIFEEGKLSIQNEIAAAETQLKNTVAKLSVDIAEKILKDELANKDKQEQLINALLKDVNVN